jgi:hypothetical protein
MPLEIHGYESDDATESFLVLRIGRSEVAPHEYTVPDQKPNLPVRRGSTTDQLRLAEIDALQGRGSGASAESPLGERYVRVNLVREGRDFFFGVQLWPVFIRKHAA